MLYARTPQQGNGRVERATAQSTNSTTNCPHAYGPRTHRMPGDTSEAAPAADQSPLTNESGATPKSEIYSNVMN